jgi:hypothetical protein
MISRERTTDIGVGDGKRLAMLSGGGMLVGYGLARRTSGGLVLALLGGALLYRGIKPTMPVPVSSATANSLPADRRPTLGMPRNNSEDLPADRPQEQQPALPSQKDRVITASEDSFPASDPPAWTGSEAGSVR